MTSNSRSFGFLELAVDKKNPSPPNYSTELKHMASNGNYFVYETIPYSYSPLRLASSCPLDNFDTLTRSMRDLTTYADHNARALAADTAQQSGTRIKSNASAKPSSGQSTPRAASADPVQLTLRPSIFSRHTPDGFVLSAATPGLRKDELKVELLDDQGESYIEVSGQALQHSGPSRPGCGARRCSGGG